jgi:predicted ATPase
LLETVRAYARGKLEESGELSAAARRHAEYHSDLFGRARSGWESQPTAAWLAEYGHRLDDLRASLEWAFSPVGDVTLGITLTVDAVPLWMQRSLMSECRRSVERALSRIKVETNENARLRMRLWTALSLSRMYTGDPLADIDAGWFATLDLAERLGDPDYQLRAIWGLFAGSFNRGNFRTALGFAERFSRVATDTSVRLIGERLVGTALHILGDQQNARRHIEHMLANYTPPVTSSHIIRYQNDQVIAAHRVLAPILWLQGYPDQAMQMVEATVAEAVSVDHALTLCNLLAQAACPLAFLVGDLALAQRLTAMLVEYATQYSLDVWNLYGRCFEGLLLTSQGDFADGLSRLRRAGDDMRRAGFMQYHTPYLGLFAEALAAAGQVAPGLAVIDEALARAESTEERWCLAELLRIKGELLAQNAGEVSTTAAENCFGAALEVAGEQGALSWELRAALSLARMRTAQNRRKEARAVLEPVYERFTEGFATADLRAAKALLDTAWR